MTQSDKCLTLDFRSGHELTVVSSTLTVQRLLVILSLPLSLPLPPEINKHSKRVFSPSLCLGFLVLNSAFQKAAVLGRLGGAVG